MKKRGKRGGIYVLGQAYCLGEHNAISDEKFTQLDKNAD